MNECPDATTLYAEVAPDGRFADRRRTLTYRVPEAFAGQVATGQIIWVPLRQKIALAVIVELHRDWPETGTGIRDIHAPVEPAFRLSSVQWQLAVWICEETLCTLFEAASLMFPPGIRSSAVEHLALAREPDADELAGLTRMQHRLIDLLLKNREMTIEAARRALDSSLTSVVPALEETGLIQRVVRVRQRPGFKPANSYQVRLIANAPPPPEHAYRQREVYDWLAPRLRTRASMTLPMEDVLKSGRDGIRQTLQALERRGAVAIERAPDTLVESMDWQPANIHLTDDQRAAWERIVQLRREGSPARVLLRGVTGSGKTELYFRTIAATLAEGRSAILLVPEIGLAGQVIERARARFGNKAVILHSALDDRRRHENWERASSGEPLLVVGPRSALFAPLSDIGLIILDEEHETAYKQDNPPRYHARTVAGRLAELQDALLILGSATPDVESYYLTELGSWTQIQLPSRVGQRTVDQYGDIRPRSIPLPSTQIVDMRSELRSGNHSIFSRSLVELIQQRVTAGEQVILFLNRRGMSTIVQCRSCGAVVECPDCDVPLVYHRSIERLVCHRCGHRALPVNRCPQCQSDRIGYFGTGTQRVEREIGDLLPSARILRWDQDVIRGNVSHETLLKQVQRGEADVIVGTQMIGKGLDLPNVTAVGIINADTYIHLPDFRATERTFQMLSQVAGRAGRRTFGGEVIVQTYNPHHYAIVNAARHDYDAFYREEIAFRRRHGYPPFKRLVRLLYRHPQEERAQEAAEKLAGDIEWYLSRHREWEGIDMLGPAPAFAARVRGRYGWQLLLRGDMAPRMLAELQPPPGWTVDVDPVNLL